MSHFLVIRKIVGVIQLLTLQLFPFCMNLSEILEAFLGEDFRVCFYVADYIDVV